MKSKEIFNLEWDKFLDFITKCKREELEHLVVYAYGYFLEEKFIKKVTKCVQE